ncbi:mucin-5AC [Micropterus salmoides]|uniref:mucin-5AC n=1 Tax=Micropterus salmoides TaxID=27706 RepID=UPI0018EBDFB1|nr:mucin-5AC [Micropterus salmoides]
MSPLFMDTMYQPNSPGSPSAEESHSNTAGSEREGEGQQVKKRGTKRRDKNRDAARKSRRKQTERADELHDELQSLERSNSALQKEIASLKKDLHLYTTTLERHKPFCSLRASESSSILTTVLPVSPSADCQTCSSPPKVPPRASSSTLVAGPSLSTSFTSSLELQTPDCVESPRLSPSAPAPTTTTLASSTSSPAELFTSSSSVTVPYSASFSTVPAPHSLFSEDAPSLITSRLTNPMHFCTSLVSSPVPSSSLTTAAQPQSGRGTVHNSPSVTANVGFSTLHPGALDAFLMKQASFPTAPSNVVPPYSHSQDVGLVVQACSTNVSQLHPSQFSGNPISSSQPCSLLPPTFQDPALQSFLASPQPNPELSPASAFALNTSYSPHVSPASLLSLLTVPSPLSMSQASSSSFDGPLSQPLPSLPPLEDPPRDLSLSELLEINDWILQ